jgi:gliding motility-associated-like protein
VKNGTLTTKVHGSTNNIGYVWSSPDPNGTGSIYHTTDADTLEFTFAEADSIYQICTYAFTDCDESEEICFYVDVTTLPDDSLGVYEICAADLAQGLIPEDWGCDAISSPGRHFCTITDTITGCTQLQYVDVIQNNISIENKDTLICGLDTLFYNGDTISGDYFQEEYIFEGGSVNGCDSLFRLTVERVRLYASVSELVCLNDEQFGLEISIDSILPADFDNLMVDWFKDDVHYYTAPLGDLQLIVSEKGNYSPMITVFKNGQSCVFDLEEVEIDRFITADFNTSSEGICLDDVITVTLDAFNISANYEWIGGDHVEELFPGVYEISWDMPGIYDLALKVDFDGCEVFSDTLEISVEDLLDKPDIQCMESTNDSIYVEWDPIDCASGYEIWLNGDFIITTNLPEFDFGDLEQGQSYEIIVNALTECLCPSTADTVTCETQMCPDDISVQVDQLPFSECADNITEDIQLTASVLNSTGGTISWTGSIVDSDGLISVDLLTAGSHPITVYYDIDNCHYEKTDTLTVFPSVEMDVSFIDISCYYNQDGEIEIMPLSGTAPFQATLNGTNLSSLDTTGLNEGIYHIELIDDNDCMTSTSIEILRPSQPDLSIIGDTFIERGQTYEYELSLEDIAYDSVVWYVPALDSVLCAGICDEISYAPLFSQDLCIELFYDQGCAIDTCINLKVSFETHVFIPNVFTPGKRDGMNDFFMIKTNRYDQLKLINFSVFDRWGEMVFHKENTTISSQTDDSFGWDGLYNGQSASSGVYIYLVEYEDENGDLIRVVGDITLIR